MRWALGARIERFSDSTYGFRHCPDRNIPREGLLTEPNMWAFVAFRQRARCPIPRRPQDISESGIEDFDSASWNQPANKRHAEQEREELTAPHDAKDYSTVSRCPTDRPKWDTNMRQFHRLTDGPWPGQGQNRSGLNFKTREKSRDMSPPRSPLPTQNFPAI